MLLSRLVSEDARGGRRWGAGWVREGWRGVLAVNPAGGGWQVQDWAESSADPTPPWPRPDPPYLLGCRYGMRGRAGRIVSDSLCVCVCVLNRIMLFECWNVSGVLRA